MLNQYQDVFRCLNSHRVKYLVLGGVAAVLHGVPRPTYDLDILIEATRENARRLLDAFIDAGMATATMTDADKLLAHEITLFRDRVWIDVQTSTPGITFDEAWPRRKTIPYAGQEFFIVSLQDLIDSKRAAGRQVDLDDLRYLGAGDDDSTDDSAG